MQLVLYDLAPRGPAGMPVPGTLPLLAASALAMLSLSRRHAVQC
jgi:hypothetical protein